VPDVTLLSLVVAMVSGSDTPEEKRDGPVSDPSEGPAMAPAWLAGGLAMLVAVRQPALMGGAYLGAGWLIKRLAARWDISEVSVQGVAVGLAEGLLLAVWLADAHVTLVLLLLAGVKLAVTVACLPLINFAVRNLSA
jgi:hypothetical protein